MKHHDLIYLAKLPDIGLDNPLKFNTIEDFVFQNLPQFLISVLAPITLVFFFINAYQYLIGAASENAVTDAKRGMLFTGIGLAIILLSYSIIALIKSPL